MWSLVLSIPQFHLCLSVLFSRTCSWVGNSENLHFCKGHIPLLGWSIKRGILHILRVLAFSGPKGNLHHSSVSGNSFLPLKSKVPRVFCCFDLWFSFGHSSLLQAQEWPTKHPKPLRECVGMCFRKWGVIYNTIINNTFSTKVFGSPAPTDYLCALECLPPSLGKLSIYR